MPSATLDFRSEAGEFVRKWMEKALFDRITNAAMKAGTPTNTDRPGCFSGVFFFEERVYRSGISSGAGASKVYGRPSHDAHYENVEFLLDSDEPELVKNAPNWAPSSCAEAHVLHKYIKKLDNDEIPSLDHCLFATLQITRYNENGEPTGDMAVVSPCNHSRSWMGPSGPVWITHWSQDSCIIESSNQTNLDTIKNNLLEEGLFQNSKTRQAQLQKVQESLSQ